MLNIETARLVLRRWKQSDLPTFIAMNKDKDVMRYFPSILTYEETMQFYWSIVAEFEHKGYGLFAVELKKDGSFIGYTGLHEFDFDVPFSPGVEIGWRLAAAYHNCGYATEAAGAVVGYAKTLGLKTLYSFTAKINKPSERVMQKIGMQKTGEFLHPKLEDVSPLKAHVLYSLDLI
ncbi:GNAT family N-acetyltransferase [uncultured Muribaculum sp.]|uniref:GNAT family N-acetyltransferase n=1 Tax=uncultured Muribaculum sp. TaxID=1918613 RepID=UPI002603AFF5|nr:GNAT family N-acetyltransferase [uncultured Muribaculum sp.]